MAILTPQLPLSLGLKDSTTFENFLTGANPEALAYLRALSTGAEAPPAVYLWGEPGAGKSHLLQALCHAAAAQHQPAFYLPLRAADEFPFEALQGLEQMRVVCLDDIQAICRQLEWSHALIELFERVRSVRGALVVTGEGPVSELGLLPALSSRLASGLSFHLHRLNPAQCVEALRLRAGRRGMRLPEDSARYLVRQFGGQLERLFATLEDLDRASLAAKRRLTLPFVRSVLNPDG
mgnify:CR=1 FL=1